jgi:hypothetical protein
MAHSLLVFPDAFILGRSRAKSVGAHTAKLSDGNTARRSESAVAQPDEKKRPLGRPLPPRTRINAR